jgi:PAS domain S-box-containing protein
MQAALPPLNETQRLERLRRFGVLDTLPQEAFDHITTLASAICGTPIALISLIDQDRQWFKSRVGLQAQQTPRELAFCAHAILAPNDIMEVEDATRDARFHDNPLVSQAPDIRFYAGMPIVTEDGLAMGTVCVIDQQPRQLNDVQRQALRSLASLVLTLLEHEELHQRKLAAQAQEARQHSMMLTSLTLAGLDLKSFVDKDLVYRYVNQCYLDYWNKKAEDIIGCSIPELLGESIYTTAVKPHFDKALQGEEVHYELLLDFPGKGPRWMEVTYLPARSDTGEVIGVVVRAHDIHTIRNREATLQTTVELLEHKTLEQQRFIHIISHDLREPINTITNFAGLIADDPAVALPAHAQRYLGFVQSGSARMKTLLDDLLEFLHMDQHAVSLSEVDASQLVNNVREDMGATIERTGAAITVGPLPVVQGDPTLLRVLIQNLVSNALKFQPKGQKPQVLIEGRMDSDQWVLSVTDNGIGIPTDQSRKIFDIFTRLNTTKEYAGSGLGLSICRRIADLHHGQITVRSVAGHGSRFELALPIQSTTQKEPHP